MKLVVSGGGTGGHVYPALAVTDVLLKSRTTGSTLPSLSAADLLWIGSQGGLEEEFVQRAGIEFVGLNASGLRGVGVLEKGRSAIRIPGSVQRARGVIKSFGPDVVLVTGGYACVAVTLAAWIGQVPVLIYLPDIVPGLAIRYLGRFAARVAVTSEESYRYFDRAKVTVTGYPVRSEIYQANRADARQKLGLATEAKTLLVFGGSQGARSINKALVAGLRELLPVCQILHISGRLDAEWVAGVAKSLPEDLRERYHHFDYLYDMPLALVASDLVVARAGAATLGEFPAARLPAVLVPYPHSGQHQKHNADYMVRNGAAKALPDNKLRERFVTTVRALLRDEQMLAAMQESARAMDRPDAAEAIAELLWQAARRYGTRKAGTQP